VRQVLNSQTSLVFKLVIKQMPVIQISLVKMLDFKQQLLMIQISFYYAGNGYGVFFKFHWSECW
jgi:hypothetical protein